MPTKIELTLEESQQGVSKDVLISGMYHKKNVDFAYLLWEDFMYQIEHKDAKKSNEIYYPRFTKGIVNFFMTKDQSIPRRNKYDAILPVELMNEAIRSSESYKEYYGIASGAEPPKTKASVRKKQSSSDTTMPLQLQQAKDSRLQQRSLTQNHISHASGSDTDEGTGIIPGVPDVPTYESDDGEISWKSSEDDDDDEEKMSKHDDDVDEKSDDDDQDDDDDDQDADDNEKTKSDNDGDDFVHPKFSTHDEEDKDEESFDPIVQTPSQAENIDDKDNDEDSHFMNQSSFMSSLFVSNMLNPSPDTGIDSIFESTPRVDVLAMITAELPLFSATTLPQPSIPIISHVQQTPAPSPANVPSLPLQDLPNFGSLFVFDHRLKTLETNFLEFMQTNQFGKGHFFDFCLSELELKNILINKTESNKSIHRSDEQKNLYKALVDAYKCDKLILDTYGDTVTLKRHRDDEDKDEEPSARSNRGSKRRREGKEPESTRAPKEKTSKTSGKSTEGSKSHHKTSSESAPAEEPMHTTQDMEEPAPQEFKTGVTDDQPVEEASQHPRWFQKQAKPLTPDRDWNKTLSATHGCIRPWISNLAKKADSRNSFNELMDTHVDFSAFVMNRLKVDTLTPKLLAGPTYELMKRSCKSLVKLEFFLEEVYKAITDQLDWNNPEGQQYPHDLLKPLPLIPNS
uniref:Uncharacterized protein n=1 Tax=Tanacetum cinerariifolium TaxID=118510 RepID=A0A6L2NU89_TANCI|nr:hypothetical protein [Tanacetum cinerariifolium]